LLTSVSLLAQPVLTATGINPVIGDQFSNKTVGYVSPGSAGAAQTWNLSTMTGTTTTTSTMVTVGSTPNGSSFPNANESGKSSSGTYSYIKTSTGAFQLYGEVAPSGTTSVVFSYSNPEDLLHFPFNYTNSYTDTWASVFTNAGSTYYRKGTDSVKYDGYGTLILPSGSYSNVSRVHFVQNYQDSTYITSFGPYIITYRNDEYFWYLNGNHQPIADVYILTNSVAAPTQSGNYATSITVGIEEENAILSSYKLFPNPAATEASVSIKLTDAQKVEIKLFNSLGAQVKPSVIGEGSQGSNEYRLDVSTLPEGIYFAQIHLDGALASTRRFVVSR